MITMENYEGWLMRYADNALSAAERQEVERFLAEHPDLREELEEVAAVKVAPVVATMPGKERLLRREPLAVWRRVAAAVALLAVVGTTLIVFHRPQEEPLVAEAVTTLPALLPQEVEEDAPLEIPVAPVKPAALKPAPSRPIPPQESVAPPAPAPEQYLAEARPETLENLEKLENLENLEFLESLEDAESPATPAPKPTATLGIVVENARLASNPWRELLAFNE